MNQVKKSGRFCGSYGDCLWEDGPIDAKTLSIFDGETGATYHRRTFISATCKGLQTVKCSESSWIAVNGEECMCVITRDTAEVKSENPDLLQIFSHSDILPSAEVSVILGTNENGVGNGIADSFAEYHEILAINYLKQKLMKKLDLTYEETLQTAISAYRLLLPGHNDANELKICVGRKTGGKKSRSCKRKRNGTCISISILPISEVAALLRDNHMASLNELISHQSNTTA